MTQLSLHKAAFNFPGEATPSPRRASHLLSAGYGASRIRCTTGELAMNNQSDQKNDKANQQTGQQGNKGGQQGQQQQSHTGPGQQGNNPSQGGQGGQQQHKSGSDR